MVSVCGENGCGVSASLGSGRKIDPSNMSVWASQGEEVGSVRLLSVVVPLSLRWNSTQKRQRQLYKCVSYIKA